MTLREKLMKSKAIAGNATPLIEIVKFIPDTPSNQRKRDSGARYSYDYAHAVMIDGIQRATWKKRLLRVGWELVDIDGKNIKQTLYHTYTRPGGVERTRESSENIKISNIDMAEAETQRAWFKGLIPTPADMKKLRVKLLRAANATRRAMWKVDRAEAIRDQAIEMHNTLSNIVASDGAGGASLRGLARAALLKVKLPPEPDLKEAPGDPPGTWLLSADRLYKVKGKKK